MDITVAYFHPFFHPDTLRRDFEQIRAAGAGAIVCAIHEQEEQRWPRDFERGLRIAQDSGLKVYLSLGRFGNLFAGPHLVPSWYTFRHPQTVVKDRHGRSHDMTCFNHESFRSWFFKEVTYYITTYPVNGILIDEPRMSDITCFCSVCRALCPDIADLQHFRQRSMIDFLNELFSRVKSVDQHARTAISILPHDLDILDDLGTIAPLDSIGCHLFWQLLGTDIAEVEHWGKTVVEASKRSGKRSHLWMQNFNLDDEHEPLLEQSFTSLLQAEPDEAACYYFWRNNDNPERVWQRTKTLLRRIPRRQLFWQTSSRLPVPPIPKTPEEKD
ncbi:MAG TPA: hypothetical protein VL461_13500 [Dictyobacter sp.]|jgi:hypothetical protein|nr:hypothetical protein [Dictyobacter sp.]